MADIPDKRLHRYRRLLPSPAGPQWFDIEEFDTADPVHDALPPNAFECIATDFLAAGHGRRGPVAAGEAHLFESPRIIPFAIEWIQAAVAKSRC